MADVQLSGVGPTAAASGLAASVAGTGQSQHGGGDVAAAAPTGDPLGATAADAGRTGGGNAPVDPLDKGQVKAAVTDANQALTAIGTQLVFVFDDQLHHSVVKLLDVQTQKVVQQIPSTAMLATASALAGPSTSGALVDTKA